MFSDSRKILISLSVNTQPNKKTFNKAMILRNLSNFSSNQEKFCISDGEKSFRHFNPMIPKFIFQRLISSKFKTNFAEISKKLRNMVTLHFVDGKFKKLKSNASVA